MARYYCQLTCARACPSKGPVLGRPVHCPSSPQHHCTVFWCRPNGSQDRGQPSPAVPALTQRPIPIHPPAATGEEERWGKRVAVVDRNWFGLCEPHEGRPTSSVLPHPTWWQSHEMGNAYNCLLLLQIHLSNEKKLFLQIPFSPGVQQILLLFTRV